MTRSSSQPSPDDLDRAFSQFFRAQLPARFPEPPIPADAPAPAAKGGWWRSRLTLGASVAALLAIGFGVSYGPTVGGHPKPKGSDIDPSGVTANGEKFKKIMDKNDVPPMDMR